MHASQKGHVSIVKHLLEVMADTDYSDFIKATYEQRKHDRQDRAKLRRSTALILASCRGYTDVVQLLLQSKAGRVGAEFIVSQLTQRLKDITDIYRCKASMYVSSNHALA